MMRSIPPSPLEGEGWGGGLRIHPAARMASPPTLSLPLKGGGDAVFEP